MIRSPQVSRSFTILCGSTVCQAQSIMLCISEWLTTSSSTQWRKTGMVATTSSVAYSEAHFRAHRSRMADVHGSTTTHEEITKLIMAELFTDIIVWGTITPMLEVSRNKVQLDKRCSTWSDRITLTSRQLEWSQSFTLEEATINPWSQTDSQSIPHAQADCQLVKHQQLRPQPLSLSTTAAVIFRISRCHPQRSISTSVGCQSRAQ